MYSPKYRKPLSYTKYEQFSTISQNHFTIWILDKLTHSAQSCWRFLKISKVEFCIFRVFPMLIRITPTPENLVWNAQTQNKKRRRNSQIKTRSLSKHAFVKCLCNSQRFCRVKKMIQKLYVIFKNSYHRYYTNSENPDLRCKVSS